MPAFDLIAFDADDTLWENEVLYRDAQAKFFRILSAYHNQAWIEARLYDTEMRNLAHFGYGIKAFVLSMIETAIELTEGRVSGREIGEIIEAGKFMLNSSPALIDGVEAVLQALAPACPLIVITKGDLLDQEAKIARSGLANYFHSVEIVSGKSPTTYTAILEKHGVAPCRFLMVGNSLRSDILPVLEIGGWAAYIPHPLTWAHESEVEGELRSERLVELARIADLLGAIERLRRLPPAAER